MDNLGHLVDSKKTCFSEVSNSPRLFLFGSVGQGNRSFFALDQMPTLPFGKCHSSPEEVEDGQNGRICMLPSPSDDMVSPLRKTGISRVSVTELSGGLEERPAWAIRSSNHFGSRIFPRYPQVLSDSECKERYIA